MTFFIYIYCIYQEVFYIKLNILYRISRNCRSATSEFKPICRINTTTSIHICTMYIVHCTITFYIIILLTFTGLTLTSLPPLPSSLSTLPFPLLPSPFPVPPFQLFTLPFLSSKLFPLFLPILILFFLPDISFILCFYIQHNYLIKYADSSFFSINTYGNKDFLLYIIVLASSVS